MDFVRRKSWKRHEIDFREKYSCYHKPTAPPAPDYAGAAQQQGAANLEAARATAHLSNPNIVGPYGSQTVSYNGDDPTVTQTLSPQEQQIFNSQMATQIGLGGLAQQGIGTVSNVLGSQYNTSNLPAQQINAGQTAQEAIMSRLQPQIERENSQLETQLANQGIMPGSEAYNTAKNLQSQQHNDLLTQAASQGINVGQQARQQALSEQLGLRELPLNEVTALMSGSQVQTPGAPPFQGASTQAGNISGAAGMQGANSLQQYGQQVGQYNANTGGLYGLGAAGMMSRG